MCSTTVTHYYMNELVIMDLKAATVYCDTFSVSQGYNKVDKRLVITTCANQDPLQATTGNNIY